MISSASAYLRWFFYCCYAVLLTAVLLYVRFPEDIFKKYCVKQAQKLFSGSECRIGHLAYYFPLSISLEGVSFSLPKQEKAPLIKLNSITISPALTAFGKVFELKGESYSGQFSGTLHLERKDNQFSLEQIKIQNMNLAEMKPIHDILEREISGLFDFTGSFSAVINQYLAGKAQGKVKLMAGKISLVQPVLAMNAIDLQQMEMEIKYDKQELQVSKGKMKGKELSADFSSTVRVISPWYISDITVTGDVAPQAGFIKMSPTLQNEVRTLLKQYKKSTIPFSVNGSLQKPTFRFGL